MSQPSHASSTGPRPPATIPELAERALDNLWDGKANLKHYLRIAERYRKEGKELSKQGDIEAAFVLLAKAATLVLEKLPTHRDYQTMLNQEQQNNLALNGQDILDHLGELKKALLERYEEWQRRHPDAAPEPNDERTPNAKLYTTLDDRDDPSPRSLQSHTDMISSVRGIREEDDARGRSRDLHQRVAEEANLWKMQREAAERRDAEVRDMKRSAASAAARQAAQLPVSYPSQHLPQPLTPASSFGIDPNNARHQQQQDDFRRREEDIRRRTQYQQQDDMARRQQAADEQVRAIRATPAGIPVQAISTPASTPNYYPRYPLLTPTQSPASPPANHSYSNGPGPSIMPLENPSRYEGDSTDSESIHSRGAKQRQTRAPSYYASQPPPITTTSPPPGFQIGYPQLMSPHQQRQGYYPSLNSMFTPAYSAPAAPSMLFDSRGGSNGLYSQSMLPQASAPVHARSYNQAPPPPQASYQQAPPPMSALPAPPPANSIQYPSYPGPSRPAPPVPVPAPPPPPLAPSSDPAARISKEGSSHQDEGSLKSVSLPKDCLPRFIAIAKVNTANNKETCGLLLGKDKGHKFVVTTLLIPKQHATSDTCTMEEEELVLQFTEERSLITLGWIHTHPSQSCFMSSVDLHTHSGFQRMLPESFAVVCAPNSTPNFGIFRLTDPPGLNAILGCTAKEAFHPHPDVPIYTDADKGHVQMKSATLEIVDLRQI